MPTLLSFLGYLIILFFALYVMTKVVDEYFLKSLDNISRWMKLTPSVAGATLLAIGTSAPELSTATFALFLEGASPATGLGTVVGSAIFQILVVIGFASLVKTAYLDWKPVIRDGLFYMFAVLLLIVVLNDGLITTAETLVMIGAYLLYLGILVIWSRNIKEDAPDVIEVVEKELKEQKKKHPVRKAAGKMIDFATKPIDFVLSFIPDAEKRKNLTLPVFVISLAIIAFSSYWMVVSAEGLALILGISPAIIALTILAGGTSMPELISSFIISKQGRGDMAISNAIGSNVFDILLSLGIPVFVFTLINGEPAPADSESIVSSLFLLFATLAMVLGLLAAQKFKIGRKFGIVLIVAYVIYVAAAYTGVI